ncbi:multidrug effflux MFS transporter [Streptomyces indicus]|uniref:MFS transporter, DHA1 family, bicyclomycin/chloramphenicol resistance protein n=1 Tax=Streptomyces indicus TaxID=417292 RepID=A0A1G9JHP8_9ACTN|nr:multidrug effflux MFS transporter [Streptomyces indicus]SDL37109.1 MFS transporter, DHA1 family, bicyclomycin/chloramphenicol resistance protein [Streptomyces indicus]
MTSTAPEADAAAALDTAGSKPPAAALPVAGRRLRLILILGGLSAFGPLSLDMYLPALPELAGEFRVPDATVQLTLTSCLVGLALGQLVAGPLSDTYGRRKPLLFGLAGYALASVLCAFAPNAEALTGLRLVQGLAGAAGLVVARAMVSDLYEGKAAARFFALLMLVNGLAPILAPLIGGQLLAVTDWRGIFGVLAVIGAGLLAAAAWGLPETLAAGRRRTGGLVRTLRTARLLLCSGEFMAYALGGGLAMAALFAYISGSTFVLQNVYGMSAQAFSLAFAGNAVALVAAGQLGARLLNRCSSAALMRAGLLVQCAGAALLLFSVATGLGLPGVLPSLVLVVASIGLISPNSTALAMSVHPEAGGTASAVLGVLQYGMGGVAAPLVGLGGTGSAWGMAVTIMAFAGAALLTGVVVRRR